jgi:hypothetical protein
MKSILILRLTQNSCNQQGSGHLIVAKAKELQDLLDKDIWQILSFW